MRPIRRGATVAAIAAALGCISTAGAGVDLRLTPYAAAQYRYDSNIYRFSDQVVEVTGTPQTGDHVRLQTGGADGSIRWQRQTLQLMAERREYRYDVLEPLDHEETTVAGTLDSWIGQDFRFTAAARAERRRASTEDRRATDLIIEHDRSANAELTVTLAPMWRVASGISGSDLQSPLPAAPALPQPPPGAGARNAMPDFAVRQGAVHAGVLYGIENKINPEIESPLVLGVRLRRATVEFRGLTPQPPPPPGAQPERFEDYSLLTLEGTASYAVSGHSRFEGRLGATHFRSAAGNAEGLPPLTGELEYIRTVSVVTELSARVYGEVVPFVPGATATSDTGIGVGAKWEPIRYCKFFADYSYAESAFTGLGAFSPENSGRSDRIQNMALRLEVPYGQWIFLRMGGNLSERRSSGGYNDYDQRGAYAELVLLWDMMGSRAN